VRTDTCSNRLNQYAERDVPGAMDILGIANPTAAVTVTADNTAHTAYRKGEYFHYALPTHNENAPWYNTVTVHSEYGASEPETGTLFVPKTQEQFINDNDGNLTRDGRWNYTWDAENRLVKVESLASAPAGSKRRLEFAYDYQGRRIASRVSSLEGATSVLASNVFLYDGWNLAAELNATNNGVIRSYVWGLDLSGSSQGAGGVGGLLTVTYNGSVTTNCFVAYDGNGNVCGLADAANGSVVAQYEYGPFGEVIRATGPMARANPFRFSTKYQDDESDLLYYGYRYYNASTGRWISRDPVEELGFHHLGPPREKDVGAGTFREDNPATWNVLYDLPQQNLYSFVLNVPVSANDHLGLFIIKVPGIRFTCGTCFWRCSEYSRTPRPKWSKSRGAWTCFWLYQCWQKGLGCIPPPYYKVVVSYAYTSSPPPASCPWGKPTGGSY